MKFIHTADLHLGMVMKHVTFASSEAHKERVYEIEAAFYRLLKHVEENAIDYLFITGDLFDHPHVGISKVDAFFKRLANLNADVFIVIGNHDTFLHNKAYNYLNSYKNIHFFSPDNTVVKLEQIDVYGMNTRDYSDATLAQMNQQLNRDKINVLCLHGDVTNPQDDHYLTDVKNLEKTNFDYIAIGHIHKHAFIRPHIAYSGNLEPVDFSETTQRGFIEGELAKPIKATFVPFAKRNFIVKTITLTTKDDQHSLREKLNEVIQPNEQSNDFIRAELTGQINADFKLDQDLFSLIKKDYYYLEFKDKTKLGLNLETLKKNYKDTIISEIIETAEHENNLDDESLWLALRTLIETEGAS